MKKTSYADTYASAQLPPTAQWPDLLFDLPELQYPDRLNCVVQLLDRQVAAGMGERMAIYAATENWAYERLLQQVNRICHVLTEDMQLVSGNRVLLRGANNPMMAACVLAVMKAGCIAVPTMPLLRAKELTTIIAKAKVNAVLCAASLRTEMELVRESARELASGQSSDLGAVLYFGSGDGDALDTLMAGKSDAFAAPDTLADDICLISFTSGTTGMPKGTMHFHRDLLAICDCFPRSILNTCADDIFIGTPPLAFTFGLGGLLLFPLRVGAATVLLEKLTPDALLKAVQDYRATICFTAPTFYRQMATLASQYDLSSLQKSVSAGEALPVDTRKNWLAQTGLAMIDGIGATELLHIFISAAGDAIRPGATGKPIPGYQACILDQDGKLLPPGVVGRLAVKGPTGCRYMADARQNGYVLNGWNLTGDAFEMDADGYFYYRSRTDDMIISAGYNIAGPEVEDALLMHPAVQECAVIGVLDPERGQVVQAFVVLKAGFAGSDAMTLALQDFVKQHIAPYKYPRSIEFLSVLPRTETGKLQRFKLRSDKAGTA
jgi:2-aminobenzoate-CoA ligase